jgi:hypothetical protein
MKPLAKCVLLGVCLASLLLSACGGASTPSPQVVGTPTPFPRSWSPFLTPTPDWPDLSGRLKCPSEASTGEEIGDKVRATAYNSGGRFGMVAENVFVDLVLSSDTVVPVQFAYPSDNFTEDGLLLGGREHIARLGRGESLKVAFSSAAKIPDDLGQHHAEPGTF